MKQKCRACRKVFYDKKVYIYCERCEDILLGLRKKVSDPLMDQLNSYTWLFLGIVFVVFGILIYLIILNELEWYRNLDYLRLFY